MSFVVISAACSADHSNIILIARVRMTKTLHVDETRSVFPNLSCPEINDGTPMQFDQQLGPSIPELTT